MESDPPEGLGNRGQALWKAYRAGLDAAGLANLLEACRCADRLDQMDDVIAGKGVLQLMHFRSMFETDDQRHLIMTVDHVLSEARQHQLALARLLQAVPKSPAKPKAVSPRDQLAERRKGRGAGTADSPRSGRR